jgi:transcriptional regulator with XRE-family HTH domain
MPVRKNSLAGEIGQRLRRIRQERGGGRGKRRPTIEQLAGVAEVSPDFLNKVELGLHLPGADVLVRLARALDVHPGELLPDVGISAEKRTVLHELQAFASQFSADEIRHLVTVARAVLGPTMPRMPAAPQSRQRRPRRVEE